MVSHSNKNNYPESDPFESDDAQIKRREERRKRKRQERREHDDYEEEGDPSLLLNDNKKPKRRKIKKERPELWQSDDNEEYLDGMDEDDQWEALYEDD